MRARQKRRKRAHPSRQITPPSPPRSDFRIGQMPVPQPARQVQRRLPRGQAKAFGPPADGTKRHTGQRHGPQDIGRRVQRAARSAAAAGPERQRDKQSQPQESQQIGAENGRPGGIADGGTPTRAEQQIDRKPRRGDQPHHHRPRAPGQHGAPTDQRNGQQPAQQAQGGSVRKLALHGILLHPPGLPAPPRAVLGLDQTAGAVLALS